MADEKKPIDWKGIRKDWETSDWSIKRIAEWYQISDTAIRKRAKTDGWPARGNNGQREVRAADGQRLFEGRAEAMSQTNDLGTLVPNLVQAMFTNFPGNSGEKVRITVAPPPKD